VVDKVIESIAEMLSVAEQKDLALLFNLLNSAIGCTALSGYLTVYPFAQMTFPARERMLVSLKDSCLGPKRKIFSGLKRLLLGVCMSFSMYGSMPETLDALRSSASPTTGQDVNPLFLGPNPATSPTCYPGPPLANGSQGHSKCTPEHDFKSNYLSFGDLAGHSFDYVIAGSGCGGGVAAATLTAAGYTVLVVEKGEYVPPSALTQVESEGMANLYEKAGLLTTDDGNMMILAGAGLGGGSRVNWACCLDTPEYVREEWAGEKGLEQFRAGGAYDDALRHVKDRMSVTTDKVEHNNMNKKLIEGCENLGYKWK